MGNDFYMVKDLKVKMILILVWFVIFFIKFRFFLSNVLFII